MVLSPPSQTNYLTSTATFTATAFSPESLNYQWQRNGTNLADGGDLSGTTNSTLTIASVSDADAANYTAVVSDATGSVTTSNAVLTVNDSLVIGSQPQSQTVGLGSNVTFTVTAYGAPPLVFQWYFNGLPVGSPATGTNVSSHGITNVGTNQAGNYSVEVFNAHDSLLSSNAMLTVKVFPPSIGIQPISQNVMMGSRASFRVSVNGTPPLFYEWQFNGTNLLNATNVAYTILAVGATDTGDYSVVVINLAGSVTSSNDWHVEQQFRGAVPRQCGGHQLGQSAFVDQFAFQSVSVPRLGWIRPASAVLSGVYAMKRISDAEGLSLPPDLWLQAD